MSADEPSVRTILFTECLQSDFVAPIEPGTPLPNRLHIGRAESRRLMGDARQAREGTGPLGRFLSAWRDATTDAHAAVHIRDWHDAHDPLARAHLDHFGEHCLRGTPGAEFVAPLNATAHDDVVVDSAILSDFVGTTLEADLRRLLAGTPAGDVRAGIIGVWTDFKVRYLAYELIARLDLTEIAVCSALTASASRAHHRAALEHLSTSLGVRVIDSIPEFLGWLGLGAWSGPPPVRGSHAPQVWAPVALGDEERRLIEHLFRDCRDVRLTPLSGGFSGSRVFRTQSLDRDGKEEVPFVVKIDTHAKVAQERVAVESIENLLGAASPRMVDYVDLESLGAIKYQFATMHAGEVTTLQRAVAAARGPTEMRVLFTDVIERLLARLYQRPALDGLQLFRYYSYRPDYVERTLTRVKEISATEDGGRIKIEGIGDTFPHPGGLYDRLDSLLAEEPADVPCAWIHGDLNLANILRDATGNTWMIDYYWTRIGHAWQDIAKLENDLKFIILKPGHDDALTGAVAWERHLIAHADLAVPLAPLPDALARDPDLARLHVAISLLRQLAGSLALEAGQQPPLFPRPYWIAQLRYSAHTLGFDECNVRQQRHALASTCLLAEAILGRSA